MDFRDFSIYEEYVDEQPMIYARRVGMYGAQNIALMERFKAWVMENENITDKTTFLGIARDNVQCIKPDQCRYDVCLLGDIDRELPDWIKKGKIEAGNYCVVLLPHTPEAIEILWQTGIQHLVALGYLLDFDRAIVERYNKKLIDEHMCEMLFPIQKMNK